MAINKSVEEKILRYHFVEKWCIGTIAIQLGIHHSVVDRVLAQAGLPKMERTRHASLIDPYFLFIIETLNEFPTLTAVRLYEMTRLRGFTGGPSQFRQRISELRPRKFPEAYLRLKTLPDEQTQVDWDNYGLSLNFLICLNLIIIFSEQMGTCQSVDDYFITEWTEKGYNCRDKYSFAT